MICISLFIIFILYTLACIADGPDVKPILNIKVGNYLHKQADKFYHAHYCHIDYCPFVHNYIQSGIREAIPVIQNIGYDLELIKRTVKISEEQKFYFNSRKYNIDIIKECKHICSAAIMKEIEYRITYDVDDCNPDGCMYVTGSIICETKKRSQNYEQQKHRDTDYTY